VPNSGVVLLSRMGKQVIGGIILLHGDSMQQLYFQALQEWEESALHVNLQELSLQRKSLESQK
jgi:hypothetical protein